MTKRFFLVLSITLSYMTIMAQSVAKLEYGALVGAMGYAGRYSVKTSVGSHTSYAVSSFCAYKFTDQLSAEAMLTFGQLKGDNSSRINSGIDLGSFSASILELAVKGKFDILNSATNKFTPYAFVGGGFYTLMGYSSSLGAMPSSDKMGFVVPVGGGIKYKLNSQTKLFLDGNVRFFSKNLDNVSRTTNNPNKYYSIMLGVSYSVKRKNQLW